MKSNIKAVKVLDKVRAVVGYSPAYSPEMVVGFVVSQTDKSLTLRVWDDIECVHDTYNVRPKDILEILTEKI